MAITGKFHARGSAGKGELEMEQTKSRIKASGFGLSRRCVCPLGYMGRQCQIKTMLPSLELVPPMAPESSVSESQQVQDLADKPSIEESSNEEGSSMEEQRTAEPLGPIVITDPPAPSSTGVTVNPAATAGKWPTEATPTTESNDRDKQNET